MGSALRRWLCCGDLAFVDFGSDASLAPSPYTLRIVPCPEPGTEEGQSQPEPPGSVFYSAPVWLYVYTFVHVPCWLPSIYHSAVVVHGREIFFDGDCNPECAFDMGVRQCHPGAAPIASATLTHRVRIGSTEWLCGRYHLLSRNCNHFTAELCSLLQVDPPAWWVNAVGVAVSYLMPHSAYDLLARLAEIQQPWGDDADEPVCRQPGCGTVFTCLKRRKHCRYCGHAFCSSCVSSSAEPLPMHSNRALVCATCSEIVACRRRAAQHLLKYTRLPPPSDDWRPCTWDQGEHYGPYLGTHEHSRHPQPPAEAQVDNCSARESNDECAPLMLCAL
eukprot:TRINITY_DN40135_c0_g1_i1.p1 TRINITY_DN40135_c0_g1~~TRINITY_DN40135_c0_g1_i1.p1  ORF type:complete len:359 (+),score=10.16 TRINITY_DN40135_c0_g1_i1:84-1079(+)